MSIAQLVGHIEKFAVNNSPLILTAIGVTGTVTTAVLAGKASYKASEIIAEERRYRETADDISSNFTPKEQVLTVWTLYVPAVGTAALTISAVILANRIGTRRAAAMAAAYSISEKAFAEYKDVIVEKLGPNKEREVRDEAAQKRVDITPVGKAEVIVTGSGECMFLDLYTGRYFLSTMETINQAVNELNYRVINHFYASLNDFYELIGLSRVAVGEVVGWNSNQLMEVTFSATVSEDNKPCMTIDFHGQPCGNYFQAH